MFRQGSVCQVCEQEEPVAVALAELDWLADWLAADLPSQPGLAVIQMGRAERTGSREGLASQGHCTEQQN